MCRRGSAHFQGDPVPLDTSQVPGETSGDTHRQDGFLIRRFAVENNVTIFTSLDTVGVLLDVLEEITMGVSTIDE